jgi:hypothetical protein
MLKSQPDAHNIQQPMFFEVVYLPMPKALNAYQPSQHVMYEDIHFDQVIQLATLMAQFDSQEIGVASQAIPLLNNKQQPFIPQQGGFYGNNSY